MSCLVKIRSSKDCRPVPLFPEICGYCSAVDAFGVENFVQRIHEVDIPGESQVVPRYCRRCIGWYADPYPHWDCSTYPPIYLGCYCDPCTEYEHYECTCVGTCTVGGGWSYNVCYVDLECVPMEFKRLGPKSRDLVMSFYRAIIERFYIMRATGCACERPAGDTGGFGFNSVFLACNGCSAKRALAGENGRRAFGGTFRDALEHLVNSKYAQTAQRSCRCGVHFYPFTPYSERAGYSPTFIPCAREYANGDAITWWRTNVGNNPYYKIFGDGCVSCHDAPWILDNTMQPDLHPALAASGGLRPLMKDVAAAYRAYMKSCDDICSYVSWRLCASLPDERLKSITTGMSALSYFCNINTFNDAIHRFFIGNRVAPQRFWLPALALALRMLSTLNAQTVRRGSCVTIPHKRITANFTLPIGTADHHFVVGDERSCFRICDVDLHCAVTCGHLIYSSGGATYRQHEVFYNLDCREWPPEYCCRETEVPVYACVCVGTCIGPAYPHYYCTCVGCWWDEGAVPYPHYQCTCIGCYGDPYPHWDCTVSPPVYCGCYCDPCSAYPHYCSVYCGCYGDPYPHYCMLCEGCYGDPYSVYERVCVGTCTYRCQVPNPNYNYICSACWQRWGMRTWCTGASEEHCASVTMTAIWPNLSGGGFQFGGAAYPARWAVRECDVAFGAVSAFVKGKCNKRAWVVNKTDRPKHTLGECKDLMSILGRGLIKAALQRAMCDQAATCLCGNTFSGTNFPTTAAGAMAEMVGENHARNIEVIRCAAEASRCAQGSGGSMYHHLRVDGGCGEVRAYLDARECFWDTLSPSCLWDNGKWLHLANIGGGSISFGYNRDYEKTSGCGGGCGSHSCDCCSGGGSGYTSTCVRHGWSLPRSSVQFGGFFGTFIFNNRAAKQV